MYLFYSEQYIALFGTKQNNTPAATLYHRNASAKFALPSIDGAIFALISFMWCNKIPAPDQKLAESSAE